MQNINPSLSENNTLSSGHFSPSNNEGVSVKQENSQENKPKEPSQENMLRIKSEPLWDIDSMTATEKRHHIEYSIEMEAKTILKLCKYVNLNGYFDIVINNSIEFSEMRV